MAATKRQATHAEAIKVYEYLKDKLRKDDNGTVEYLDQHTDESVAVALGVGKNTVSSIRTQMYGQLIKRAKSSTEERIARLEKQLADLTVAHNKLVNMLSLNKVANVRHLEVAYEPSAIAVMAAAPKALQIDKETGRNRA